MKTIQINKKVDINVRLNLELKLPFRLSFVIVSTSIALSGFFPFLLHKPNRLNESKFLLNSQQQVSISIFVCISSITIYVFSIFIESERDFLRYPI